jgi:hypothetical protein
LKLFISLGQNAGIIYIINKFNEEDDRSKGWLRRTEASRFDLADLSLTTFLFIDI